MADKIEKFLRKLSAKERIVVKKLISKILSGAFDGLDIKKMKGYADLYRVRQGSIRVVFADKQNPSIVFIGRRGSSEYDKL